MEHSASGSSWGDHLSYFIKDPGTGTLYRRGPLLGQGAFGRCYKSTDAATGKVYAVKVVSLSRISRLASRGKVEREIELHSQLSHRHIVGFHRHFADRDNIYMVLEYCSRKSLAHVLKARKTLTEPEVRYYLRQIIAGLRYLHQQGIIHRDLKLSNFFLTKTMQVKIGDLGLATREEQAGRRRGVVCGTPNYLAPEVLAKKGHSCQSDVWALGCIMYAALTGRSPFEVAHKQEMYQCIREGRYPAPDHLSPGARQLIRRLLAPSPSERPSLEEVLEHEFFTQGFTPDKLPSRACHSVPVFALPNPLSRLLQTAAKVLFWGSPCPEARSGSRGPAEEPEKPGSRCRPAGNLSGAEQHSQPERGSTQATRLPEAPSRFPVRLLVTGPLRPSRPAADCRRSSLGGFLLLPSRRVPYRARGGKALSFSRGDVPASPATELGILHFFPQDTQQKLLEVGKEPGGPGGSVDAARLLRCAKSDRALLMLFSNGTLQVSFYHHHAKPVLSRPRRGGPS